MTTTTQMYWLTRLDSIKWTLDGFTTVFVFVTLVLVFIAVLTYSIGTFTSNGTSDAFYGKTDDELKSIQARLRRVSARCAVAAFLLLSTDVAASILNALLPSTREIAAILIVPRIANSEKVQQADNKLYDLAVEWMDELRPKKAKETDK